MDNEKVSLILRMLFQSPSGVLGVCRLAHDRLAHVLAHVFQSPSGVLGVCRPSAVRLPLVTQRVSVPFRGFRGLQDRIGGTLGLQSTGFSPLPGF